MVVLRSQNTSTAPLVEGPTIRLTTAPDSADDQPDLAGQALPRPGTRVMTDRPVSARSSAVRSSESGSWVTSSRCSRHSGIWP